MNPAAVRHADFPGGRVSARLLRDGSAQPDACVALLHGLGESERVWEPLARHLPAGLRLWSFELPWDAADGSDWTVEAAPAVWLERALDLAGCRPRILIAHSYAANALLDLLCAGTGALDPAALVLFSPFYRSSSAEFDWPAISHYLNDFTEVLYAGIQAQARPRDPDLAQAMAERVRDRIGVYGWLAYFTLFTATPRLDLDKLRAPCLVIGGETDTASYPRDCRALARALPDARVEVIGGGGHFTMLEDPLRAAALISRFLEESGLAPVPTHPLAENR
ncbi:alpha/beta fold hydrolase [Actinocrinis puniceicyclus]|uniref:Alpha/beta fold hydrolase n=1 Tax=Actinocrinis puniceicyclus TaxID=977794 RepID=A0A8J7WK59_9ACTN|nr:alpha/beta fold hydrolase [Actinocrinis puniceicyclus]MBS2962360.1 alpha/beta fold hydrolase [Actinocrinis puniceicyclus]